MGTIKIKIFEEVRKREKEISYIEGQINHWLKMQGERIEIMNVNIGIGFQGGHGGTSITLYTILYKEK